VIPDAPARLLVAMSKVSSLVVVGSRGHGPPIGSLLGTVSLAVLRHGHTTVAVIRCVTALADRRQCPIMNVATRPTELATDRQ
jgi:hypothetical protein